jgi:hypothetical protein
MDEIIANMLMEAETTASMSIDVFQASYAGCDKGKGERAGKEMHRRQWLMSV